MALFWKKSCSESYRFVLNKRQISQNTYDSVLPHIYPILLPKIHMENCTEINGTFVQANVNQS